MRKAVLMCVVGLAATVAFTFRGKPASAEDSSSHSPQAVMMGEQMSNRPSGFNSNWFVYGVPSSEEAVRHERTHADAASKFNSNWFVYGVPVPSQQGQAK